MSAPARPETLYRKHVEMCHLPENEHTFDFMSDYLTMMDILAKAITHGLEEACRITPLQYRIMIRMLADSDMHTKSLSGCQPYRSRSLNSRTKSSSQEAKV